MLVVRCLITLSRHVNRDKLSTREVIFIATATVINNATGATYENGRWTMEIHTGLCYICVNDNVI